MQTKGKYQFTLAGKSISLTRNDVEDAIKQIRPEKVKKYSVRIGGIDFPIKQAVAAAAHIPIAAFITTDAYRVLSRLGFEIKSA